ncbi:MAG: hypothetical protein C4519_28625 [Desulfobacteraceae bacterium]|nr:MAG: hypothetical protein C4519_28625 [Desulfobacteraceae bacterium]
MLTPACAAAQTHHGGIFRTHTASPSSLDPHTEAAGTTPLITNTPTTHMLRLGPDMTGLEADLAKRWPQIDELTYEFKLHVGGRFHGVPPVDGRELTSSDVKYRIERVAGMHGKAADLKQCYYFEG